MKAECRMTKVEFESLVTWERSFGGHPTKLSIVKYESWTEVFLDWDNSPKQLIGGVPLEVLREIVRLADALPKVKP